MTKDGVYQPSRHLEQARFDGRVPGGDYEGFVDAHVRRLEALRRAGIVERIDADRWRIPEDFESRAAAHDAGRSVRVNIRVLSAFDLESQIGADGATWLDRRLIAGEASDLAPAGFGQAVAQAMDRRREHLIDQGDATRQPTGRVFYRRNLLATLREREVARAGAELAVSKPMPFRASGDGETVSGTFTGTVQLASGRFAIVEKSHEFTLVPGGRSSSASAAARLSAWSRADRYPGSSGNSGNSGYDRHNARQCHDKGGRTCYIVDQEASPWPMQPDPRNSTCG